MSVIACLRIPPTPAVCDLCAELTPVVEPAAECMWMDWTGCLPVPVLAARLAEAKEAMGWVNVPHRLGVAPRRFAAGVLASPGITAEMAAARAPLPVQAIPGGYWVQAEAWPAFAARLPVALLPELEPETRAALATLDVRTLGDLLSIPRELLQGHLGAETGRLLDWARGHDPRPVRALYPPERLVHRLSGETLAGAGAERLETAIRQAASVLAERLQAAGQACARLAIVWGECRYERHFTSPIADAGQLARVAWQATRQVLSSWTHSRLGPSLPPDSLPEIPGDCVLEITPTGHWGRQTLLWEPDRPSGDRHHPALAAVRARFGHTFHSPSRPDGVAGGDAGQRSSRSVAAGRVREAVAHYEAMNRFYRFSDRQ